MNEDMPRASFFKCLWCHQKRARHVQTPGGEMIICDGCGMIMPTERSKAVPIGDPTDGHIMAEVE